MAPNRRSARPLAEGIRSALSVSTELGGALATLVEFLEERGGCSQALVLVRAEDRVEGASSGLPPDHLSDLLRAVRRNPRVYLPFEFPLTRRGSPFDESPLFIRFPQLQVIPFRVPSANFAGVLLVEMEESELGIDELQEFLNDAALPLSRIAETDRLQQELEKDRAKVAHLESVLDALPDPVVVLDETGKVVLSNRRANDLLLHSLEGDSSGRRHAVETNNLFFSAFLAETVLGEGTNGRELLLIDPVDGSDLFFEIPSTVQAGNSEPRDVQVHILRDITDLKRASAELGEHYKRSLAAEARARQESERLNAILANIGVPILVTDGWSDIDLMNQGAARLFESGAETGATSQRSGRVLANDAKITGLISDFLLQPQQRRAEEFDLVDPDRLRSFPVRAMLTKIVNRRGEPTSVICVVHDQSEKAEIERLAEQLRALNLGLERRIEEATAELSERNRELERRREELARASKLKTEFLAMMSHELRTPINSILGYISLLREDILGQLEDRQRQALERMDASSEHLLSLINDLLDLSMVEAGKLALSPVDIDSSDFVKKLSESLRPIVEGKGLAFRIDVAEGLPSVRADATRLRQVILNLASNAIKFTSEGRIVLRAFALPDEGFVRFEVEDTGPGIEEDDQKHIFDAFWQAGRFETREHGGTGLGLSISRKLLTMMDGRVGFRSHVGVGSVFYADVPIAGVLPREGHSLASLGSLTDRGAPE